MAVETIIEHDEPGFEPGNPSPQTRAGAGRPGQATAAIDEVLRVLFLMPLPALGPSSPGGTGIDGDCYVELES
jgi:hypothetical protein